MSDPARFAAAWTLLLVIFVALQGVRARIGRTGRNAKTPPLDGLRRILRRAGLCRPEPPKSVWRVDREGIVFTDARMVVLRARR